MHKRIEEIESVIRDSKQRKVEITFSEFSNDILTESVLKITFIKFEKEIIELVLYRPSKINIFDDDLNEDYISHIKAFENANGIEISLDPYDERIDKIEDRDNYVFHAKSYEISATKI